MKEKKEKLRRHGWKSRFARLAAMLTVCFNAMTTSLVTVGATVGVGAVAAAVILVTASCQKEQPEPIQKHNVELTYGLDPDSQWQNISMDTLYKYNADPKVDTIFMVPEHYNQWETFNANQLRYCINRLRPRHNINPNKIFGKGDLMLDYYSVDENPEIVRFFADTLRYNVTFYNNKSR
ncbi:MAG: hypothetical protein J6X86_05535 [Bacteroidales bacterium]|nr:hypothetical protein [Bacteroidales bacterium]